MSYCGALGFITVEKFFDGGQVFKSEVGYDVFHNNIFLLYLIPQ